MGIQERRERDKQEMRQKILAAAQEIINAEGFRALSMRKLAGRIEYSAAAIYLHFRSREEIARELSEAGYRQLLAVLSQAAEEKEAAARLKGVALAYVAFGIEHPETYRLIFMGDSEYMAAAFADRRADNPADRSFQVLVDLAGELKRKGHYRGKSTAREVAEIIWAAMHGVVSLKLTCAGFPGTATARLARTMAGVLVKGLIGLGVE